MTDHWLPIDILVRNGVKNLGISRAELSRRCGYKNLAKGIDRIDDVCRGDLTSEQAKTIIKALPSALEMKKEKVDAAIRETANIIEEANRKKFTEQEAAWRNAFKPHAIILTERTRPEPIFAAAFIGVNRILRVDFDLTADRASFVQQGLNGIRLKLAEFPSPSGVLPCFGRPTGFVVNYTPDRAIRFDLDGDAVAIVPQAFRVGDVALLAGESEVSPNLFRELSFRECCKVYFYHCSGCIGEVKWEGPEKFRSTRVFLTKQETQNDFSAQC